MLAHWDDIEFFYHKVYYNFMHEDNGINIYHGHGYQQIVYHSATTDIDEIINAKIFPDGKSIAEAQNIDLYTKIRFRYFAVIFPTETFAAFYIAFVLTASHASKTWSRYFYTGKNFSAMTFQTSTIKLLPFAAKKFAPTKLSARQPLTIYAVRRP